MKYKTKVSRKIEEVNMKKWDSVAKTSFMKTNILKILENLELCKDSYYLEVYDNDKLVTIAVFYSQNNYALYDTLDKTLYGNYHKYVKFILGFNPSLICYFPYSPFYEMYQIKEGYNKKQLFNLISKELKNLAISNKYKSYAILSVQDKKIAKSVHNLFPIFSGYKVAFKIENKNFEEYASNIGKKSHRATVRKDRRLFKESEYKIERLKKLNGYEKEVLDLFNENIEKYSGNKNRKFLSEEFIKALDGNSDNVTYFIGKLKDKIISALMIIEDNEKVIALRVGQSDLDENSKGFPFYNIAIYEPLIYAIENSKSSLELGTGNYQYKIRRGAQLIDAYNLISSTNRFKNMYLHYIIRILDRRNRLKHLNRLDKRGD